MNKMNCPYRFTLENAECVKEECHGYTIIQRPKMVEGELKHIPTGHCKLLQAKIN